MAERATMPELLNGKLPPEIFILGNRWFIRGDQPAGAEIYIEVVGGGMCSMVMSTEAKDGSETYRQYFRKVEGNARD